MPGFDRTGPKGQVSQKGRKLGKCNSNNQESIEQLDVKESHRGLRRRFGGGKGKGLGLGRGAGRNEGKGLGRRIGRGNS